MEYGYRIKILTLFLGRCTCLNFSVYTLFLQFDPSHTSYSLFCPILIAAKTTVVKMEMHDVTLFISRKWKCSLGIILKRYFYYYFKKLILSLKL
jgi:hypothetical protein